jgi:hypothetical protein
MNRRWLAPTSAVLVLAVVAAIYALKWRSARCSSREEILAAVPSDASAVFYIDLETLRQSPFLAAIYKWAPQPAADTEYMQFVQSTGFDYERHLNRVGLAIRKRRQDSILFALADGLFDRKKISAYASQSGTRETRSGRETFSVPLSESSRRFAFTFLRDDRIALTDGPDLESFLSASRIDSETQPWRERFRRLAGSPLFAVIRQDAAPGAALAAQTPGGLQSPQLSALLDQLQWITVAGKQDNDRMRIVVEGECATDTTMRQLSDLLNGVLTLAQAGLAGSKVRDQLGPQVREAYLELLKSADVSQMDRGDTKAVRLVFDVTPRLLEAARTSAPNPLPQNKALSHKPTTHN